MKIRFQVILLILLSSSSFSQIQKDTDYFPLTFGNKWIYAPVGYNYPDTVSIVDTQRVNGKLYYAVKENSSQLFRWIRKINNQIYIADTTAARLDTSYIKEYLIYDFSADTGKSWDVPLTDTDLLCNFGGTVKLGSTVDSVATPLKNYTDCYYFSREAICRDAGRVKEWFAPFAGRVAYFEESIAGIREYFLSYSYIVTGTRKHDNSNSLTGYKLWQNYPNPFNPSTVIYYSIPKGGTVILKVFNSLGQDIKTLINGYKQAGTYEINFNASDLSSGVYFYRLSTDAVELTKKMILLH